MSERLTPEAVAACMAEAEALVHLVALGSMGAKDVARALAQRDAARLDGIAQAYDNGFRRAEEQIGAENERLRERAAALERDLREALAAASVEAREADRVRALLSEIRKQWPSPPPTVASKLLRDRIDGALTPPTPKPTEPK